MSLVDEARAQQRANRSACTIGVALKDDDGELAEALEAVRSGTLQSRALERALIARNVRMSAQTIRRHCRGECQCNDAS